MSAKRKLKKENWSKALDDCLYRRFRMKFETTFNIFEMAMVTRPAKEGDEMTDEMRQYITGFMDCWELI